jgi:anthranilate phosphoribosyltransferase
VRGDTIDPEKLGFAPAKPEDVAVTGKAQALKALTGVLTGKGPRAMMDMAALNLAAAIHLLEDGLTLAQAADKARDAVHSGAGGRFVPHA